MSFPFSTLSSLKIFLVTLFFIFLSGCAPSGRIRNNEKVSTVPSVRILLNEPAPKLLLPIKETAEFFSDKRKLGDLQKGDELRFSIEGGLTVYSGKIRTKADNILIKTRSNFSYQDKKLNGNIKISSDGKLVYLINEIPLEDYLKGVIPSEMPLGKGTEYLEGLKAFAICARTFTINRLMSGNSLYDVRTDVRDQVYGGANNRSQISDQAVDQTKGLILSYDNKPASVFYSSTCGGKTEDKENVFGGGKVPYLKSITDGSTPLCSVSPRIEWQESFSSDRIISLLQRGGKLKSGRHSLTEMVVKSRFSSGRINELEFKIRNSTGVSSSVSLFGNNIRFVLLNGRNQTLNSNNFIINRKGNEYILKGKGWGHGVGLCQWGTLSQSAKGINYKKILSHYFSGTSIVKHYD
jgi:stage II sporulation protein D